MKKTQIKKRINTSKKRSRSEDLKVKTKKHPKSMKKNSSNKLRKIKDRKKKKRYKKSRMKRNSKLIEISLTLGIVFLLIVLMNLFVCKVSKFEGYSMVPTLNDQDRLFVSKLSNIKRFDLVYIKDANNEVSVRRVIGMPNEQVAYREDELYINNELKAERFLTKQVEEVEDEPSMENFNLYDLFKTDVVPSNKYFVLGDNREYATDSREYGFVDEKAIIGVVKAKIFPFYDMRQF